jgi:hypothetical protein
LASRTAQRLRVHPPNREETPFIAVVFVLLTGVPWWMVPREIAAWRGGDVEWSPSSSSVARPVSVRLR